MTGSAKPPADGQLVIRDPVYGYESGMQPNETLISIHDRTLYHSGELPATLVSITEIDPTDLPYGMTLFDAIAFLVDRVTVKEEGL